MEYERVCVVDEQTGEETIQLISINREPVDIDRLQRPVSLHIRKSTINVRRMRCEIIPILSQSPSQDATLLSRSRQGPKTLGGTNEFISAFWVNGKPKCRKGYRYDFRRKMCRLIK